MKNLFSIFLIFCLFSQSKAATDITIPSVSGHWTTGGSPYKIFNNISIPTGQTLIIDPGVEIIFQGFYTMTVPTNSYLIAKGTASSNIKFRANDTTGWSDKTTNNGGWSGITFTGTYFSHILGDSLVYCNFTDIKMGGVSISARNINIRHCNFSHCHTSSTSSGRGLVKIDADTTNYIEISRCNFYNNALDNFCSIVYASGSASTYIHECSFNNNKAISALYVSYNNLLMEKNDLYNNIQEADLSATGNITIRFSKAVLKGNKIYNNTGREVGALSCYNSFVDINGNYFYNNRSSKGFVSSGACGQSQGAGAIRIHSDDSAKNHYCTIRDNVIANNFAAYSGGAIYIWRISANIYNNQIVHNGSGDGSGGNLNSASIHLDNNPITAGRNCVRVKNNLFYENAGYGTYFNGYALRVWGGDSIEYTNNWTNNPYHIKDVWDGGVSGSYTYLGDTATNIIGTNPGMINPTTTADITEDATDNNFALLSTSPCINMGDTTGINVDLEDVSNHQRIYGVAIDIGAHEYGPWTATLSTQPIALGNTTGTFGIYPNPATTAVFIKTPATNGKITIQNYTGSVIAEQEVKNTLTSFDICKLPRGIYFATWVHEGMSDTQKLILQ